MSNLYCAENHIERLEAEITRLRAQVAAADRLRNAAEYVKSQLDVALPNIAFPCFTYAMEEYDALKTTPTED